MLEVRSGQVGWRWPYCVAYPKAHPQLPRYSWLILMSYWKLCLGLFEYPSKRVQLIWLCMWAIGDFHAAKIDSGALEGVRGIGEVGGPADIAI